MIDRYLHIHSTDDKSQQKIYLKSRLSALLLKSSWDGNDVDNEEEVVVKTEVVSDEDGNDDEIWGNMEVVQTKTKREDVKNSNNKKKIKRKQTGEESGEFDKQSKSKNVKNKKKKTGIKA